MAVGNKRLMKDRRYSMFKQISSLVLALVLVSSNAFAGLITFDTKAIDGPITRGDLRNDYENNGNAFTSREIDDFSLIGIGRNSIGHVNISFDMQFTNTWTLDFGLDAGYGAEVYVDGVLVVSRTDDLWWRRDWTNSDTFSLTDYTFGPGSHNIDLYFAESCCDGLSSIRLTNSFTQNVSILTNSTLQAATVPEPESIMLFAMALFGLALRYKAS